MTREQAYDEHISPLMRTIIAACKEHNIQFVAAFNLEDAADPESAGMLCKTVILPNPTGNDERLLRMRDILYPPEARPIYISTTKADGTVVFAAVLP